MKTAELILRQVIYLRHCLDESNAAGTDYASDKNTFEQEEAKAGFDLYNGHAIFNSEGEQLFLTNDTTRKYYVKDKTVTWSAAMNKAKEKRDSAAQRVEVEISVLSALKQISSTEEIDDALLAKYDLLPDADGI